MKILVADDDPIVVTIVTAGLTAAGHDVVACRSGDEAWDAYKHEHFPIVVTDWSMPGLDGIGLTRMIRRTPQRAYTYIIMLTANTQRDHYLVAVNSGVDAFLVKPVDNAILEAQVTIAERILGREAHTNRLEAIMTVCSLCKRVARDGSWISMEKYVAEALRTVPERAYCDDCMTDKIEPELARLGITTRNTA
jgi:DNA-binding response OmpR family regulator